MCLEWKVQQVSFLWHAFALMCMNPKEAWESLYVCSTEEESGADQWEAITSVNAQRDGCYDFLSTVKVRDTTIIWLRAHPTLSCPPLITRAECSAKMRSGTLKNDCFTACIFQMVLFFFKMKGVKTSEWHCNFLVYVFFSQKLNTDIGSDRNHNLD